MLELLRGIVASVTIRTSQQRRSNSIVVRQEEMMVTRRVKETKVIQITVRRATSQISRVVQVASEAHETTEARAVVVHNGHLRPPRSHAVIISPLLACIVRK